jgi:hypothetical protein
MIKVEYTPNGIPISDFECAEFAANILGALPDTVYKISTENLFHEIRAQIAEDKLPHDQIVFVFEGEELHINEYGVIQYWPRDFCANSSLTAERCLRAASKKYTLEREKTLERLKHSG